MAKPCSEAVLPPSLIKRLLGEALCRGRSPVTVANKKPLRAHLCKLRFRACYIDLGGLCKAGRWAAPESAQRQKAKRDVSAAGAGLVPYKTTLDTSIFVMSF